MKKGMVGGEEMDDFIGMIMCIMDYCRVFVSISE